MRWIEIDIRDRRLPPRATACCEQAALQLAMLEDGRLRHGLNDPTLEHSAAAIGQLLFRAVTEIDRNAFAADRGAAGPREPSWPGSAHPPFGYHLILPAALLGLPWNWLHNGLRFLIEDGPISVAPTGLGGPEEPEAPSAWRRRRDDVMLAREALGPETLAAAIGRLRPADCAEPEILFLAGGGRARPPVGGKEEAKRVRDALETIASGPLLARLAMPDRDPAPGELIRRIARYQGIHYAGRTASPTPGGFGVPPRPEGRHRALTGDLAVAEPTLDPDAATAAAAAGQTGSAGARAEVASLLADVAAPPRRRAARRGEGRRADPLEAASWLLEDGPIHPETLARMGTMPSLIFSNSYRSAPRLAARFLRAGAAAFVGTHVAIDSAEAAAFAARFYRSLATGAGAAVALREAALACRAELGSDHPAWLAYGLLGSGDLALPFL